MSTRERVPRATPLARRWRVVEIARVQVAGEAHCLSADHVASLCASFQLLGGELLIQPIVVDDRLTLIDGAHRLAAAKQLGWRFVPAVVFEQVNAHDRALMLAEANRVRKSLSVVELEQEWRNLYAPELEYQAKQRQLAGLRKRYPHLAQQAQKTGNTSTLGQAPADGPTNAGEVPPSASRAAHDPSPTPSSRLSVIGNSNNRESGEGRAESIAKAAKRITGFSIDTLNKVAVIRGIAESTTGSEELRAAAKRGLQNIAASRASVDAVHRQLRNTMQSLSLLAENTAKRTPLQNPIHTPTDALLEHLLAETSLLAERLGRDSFEILSSVSNEHLAGVQLLEGVRSSLTIALAHVVAAESLRHEHPVAELRRLIVEAGQLCSRTAHERLAVVPSLGTRFDRFPEAA